MMSNQDTSSQRVLIASTHPLFGKGLLSLLENRWAGQVTIVGLVSTVDETKSALKIHQPDLLIIDYDDRLSREELLQQFIQGREKMRIVLLSLKDGQEGAEAIVYDRRKMAASNIEDWLHSRIANHQDFTGDIE